MLVCVFVGGESFGGVRRLPPWPRITDGRCDGLNSPSKKVQKAIQDDDFPDRLPHVNTYFEAQYIGVLDSQWVGPRWIVGFIFVGVMLVCQLALFLASRRFSRRNRRWLIVTCVPIVAFVSFVAGFFSLKLGLPDRELTCERLAIFVPSSVNNPNPGTVLPKSSYQQVWSDVFRPHRGNTQLITLEVTSSYAFDGKERLIFIVLDGEGNAIAWTREEF